MDVLISGLSEDQKNGMEHFIQNLQKGKLKLSPSAVKKLVTDPQSYFKTYVCDDFDNKETAAQKKGTLIHTLVLEPEKFDEKYIVQSEGMTMPSDRELKLLEYISSAENCKSPILNDYEKEILEYLVMDNYHQALVTDKNLTGDQKRLEKVLTSKNKEYFSYLVESRGKTIITSAQYDDAKIKADLINADLRSDSLKLTKDLEDVTSEIELETVFEGYKLKCILDSLKISVPDQKVYITDLKSIGGTIDSLIKWDYEKYQYFIQAIICYLAVEKFISAPEVNEQVPGICDYEIEFSFLFIDSANTVFSIKISNETMDDYKRKLSELLKEVVGYHLNTLDFSTRFDLINNLLIL